MQQKRWNPIQQLTPLKKALRELAEVGEEEHEGPLIDLVVLLSKIVRTYEHKGIHYTLEKYAPELIKSKQTWIVRPDTLQIIEEQERLNLLEQ